MIDETAEFIRQERIIASIGGLTDAVSALHDTQVELIKWLQQPASSDLSDLLKILIIRMDTSNSIQVKHGAMLVKLGVALGVELVEV